MITTLLPTKFHPEILKIHIIVFTLHHWLEKNASTHLTTDNISIRHALIIGINVLGKVHTHIEFP